jgi:WhiB family redox-sensing transcriptional regulator
MIFSREWIDVLGSETVPWMAEGVCRVESIPVDVFFPGERTDIEANNNRRRAKAACRRCPVAMECLDYAINTQQEGIWGGHTKRGRINLVKRGQYVA